MADDAVDKVMTAEAWSEFCELLKKAGDVILRDDLDTDAFDRGEGLRYLTRLLRAGFSSFAENTGAGHPYFRAMADRVKMGLDNPDNYYLGASINARYTYRIRGKRGTIHYLSFAAQNQNFAATDKLTGGAGHLEGELGIQLSGHLEQRPCLVVVVLGEFLPASRLRPCPCRKSWSCGRSPGTSVTPRAG